VRVSGLCFRATELDIRPTGSVIAAHLVAFASRTSIKYVILRALRIQFSTEFKYFIDTTHTAVRIIVRECNVDGQKFITRGPLERI
jgi:hypothetical protein